MSKKMFTHATPTLFNAGTSHNQLASCFLLQVLIIIIIIMKHPNDSSQWPCAEEEEEEETCTDFVPKGTLQSVFL
jgi:hypothetical protein